jgi:hypothetical protein
MILAYKTGGEFMNADENEIFELLKAFPDQFVSVGDVSRRLGSRHRYSKDKNWAAPILRRMEMDGVVEANGYGEYKLKSTQPVLFKESLEQAHVSLGETTIISLDRSKEKN